MRCGGLGDDVERALKAIGLTAAVVERWLGECCCQERKEKLNALDLWARRKGADAKRWLETLIS